MLEVPTAATPEIRVAKKYKKLSFPNAGNFFLGGDVVVTKKIKNMLDFVLYDMLDNDGREWNCPLR